MKETIKLPADHFSGAKEILLTTERAESSYGIPVAVLVGGKNSGMVFGRDDFIPCENENDSLVWLVESAGTTVLCAHREFTNNAPASELISSFCL